MSMENKLFIDTWGWLVIADRKEDMHDEVVSFYKRFREEKGQVITTDYVLSEVITKIFKRHHFVKGIEYVEALFEMERGDYLYLAWITKERFQKAWELRVKYQDKTDISFTDLTSFVVMEELGIKNVLTEDDHFKKVNLGFGLLP